MGKPEGGERRVSRVKVPVEITGVEAGFTPWGRDGGMAEEDAEDTVVDVDGLVGDGLAGV